jgi:hypothetical protein
MIDERVIKDFEYVESLYMENRKDLLDVIVIGKCTGNANFDPRDWLCSEMFCWLRGKNLLKSGKIVDEIDENYNKGNIKDSGFEMMWDRWVEVLKEDFYKEFSSCFRKVGGLILSEPQWEGAYNENSLENIKPYSDEEVVYKNEKKFKDTLIKLASGKIPGMYCREGDVKKSIAELNSLQVNFVPVKKDWNVTIILEFGKNMSGGLAIRIIRIKDNHSGSKVAYWAPVGQFIPVEKMDLAMNENTLKNFKNKLEALGAKEIDEENVGKSVRVWRGEKYDLLLELYTGYLKYGSVDNYIKYCQEDDERVDLNIKIAYKELIKEFRNQLQQKGIRGKRLETAVADFVKFLEKQDEESGADAPYSESAAPQGGTKNV